MPAIFNRPSVMPAVFNPPSVMPGIFNPPSVIPDIFNRESTVFPKQARPKERTKEQAHGFPLKPCGNDRGEGSE